MYVCVYLLDTYGASILASLRRAEPSRRPEAVGTLDTYGAPILASLRWAEPSRHISAALVSNQVDASDIFLSQNCDICRRLAEATQHAWVCRGMWMNMYA